MGILVWVKRKEKREVMVGRKEKKNGRINKQIIK